MKNANGEEYNPGKCSECRGGEHEDYTEEGAIFKIYDAGGKYVKKAYLCEEHQVMYTDDGYELKE